MKTQESKINKVKSYSISERIKYCTPGTEVHDVAARLADAAPDLYSALLDAVEQLRSYGADDEDVADIVSAIAKAEGKE